MPSVRFYATYCAIDPEGKARSRGRTRGAAARGRRVWIVTNPSGKQVISFCGGHGERYDHGHLGRVTVHPPMYGMNFGAAFAW